jgi:hypothetical protein
MWPLVLVLFLGACHCPSPVGFCAHDLAYIIPALSSLAFVKVWLRSFHWKNHKSCAHHPHNEVCKDHDHLAKDTTKIDCVPQN